MPFIRYTRDKRGYEVTFVMHAYRSPQGTGRTRVLYMFRSPAHLQGGRQALDDEARDGLEHTHPDLTFDWHALNRDATTTTEVREHRSRPGGQRPRHGQGDQSRRQGGQPQQAPRPAAALVDDQSTLGRALGAAEASRLRSRYQDLLGRITRRARTPEDRDRLMERLQRLNPDDWSDEAAAKSGVRTIEADWQALAQELPQRRRGRRGGRPRPGQSAGDDQASGIMTSGGDTDADPHDREEPRDEPWDPKDDEPDRSAAPGGIRGAAEHEPDGGPDPGAGTRDDVPGDR